MTVSGALPPQRLVSDRIPMDLSSIHSRIPLGLPGASTPGAATSPPAQDKSASQKKSPGSGAESSPTLSPLMQELPNIRLGELLEAEELLAKVPVAASGAPPRQLIHSRIPMDLRPPSQVASGVD